MNATIFVLEVPPPSRRIFSKNRPRRIDAPWRSTEGRQQACQPGRAPGIDRIRMGSLGGSVRKGCKSYPAHEERLRHRGRIWCGAPSRRGRAAVSSISPPWGGILNGPMRAQGGVAMPVYEYHCDKCRREVEVTQSISEHGKGTVACPKCGSTALRPLVSSFFTQ